MSTHQRVDRPDSAETDQTTIAWLRASAAEVRTAARPGLAAVSVAAGPTARRRRRMLMVAPAVAAIAATAVAVGAGIALRADSAASVVAVGAPPTAFPSQRASAGGGPRSDPSQVAVSAPATAPPSSPGATAAGGPIPVSTAAPGSANTIAVPDVRGKSRSAALSVLSNAGLNAVADTAACADGAVAGQVVEQSPAAGSRVGPASDVTVLVAADCAVVPNVVGNPFEQASSALRAAGFGVGVTGASPWNPAACAGGTGPVTSQTPAAGTLLVEGGWVSVEYACLPVGAASTAVGS